MVTSYCPFPLHAIGLPRPDSARLYLPLVSVVAFPLPPQRNGGCHSDMTQNCRDVIFSIPNTGTSTGGSFNAITITLHPFESLSTAFCLCFVQYAQAMKTILSSTIAK